jgi:hypothetical protein
MVSVDGRVVVLDTLCAEHLAETLALFEDCVRHANGDVMEDLALLLGSPRRLAAGTGDPAAATAVEQTRGDD